MSISLQKLQSNFNRAAASYDSHAEFQQAVLERLLELAESTIPEGAHVLDIGCGTGQFAKRAQKNDWHIVAIDIAAEMCAIARTRCNAVAQANAAMLPFADGSFQAISSSLCLQWVDNKSRALQEIWRTLMPGGIAIIATLGTKTLKELREQTVELPLRLLSMNTTAEYKALAVNCGFEILSIEDTPELRYYPSARALLESMRQVGARNAESHGNGMPPRKLMQMLKAYDRSYSLEKGVYATWQPIIMQLRKPL